MGNTKSKVDGLQLNELIKYFSDNAIQMSTLIPLKYDLKYDINLEINKNSIECVYYFYRNKSSGDSFYIDKFRIVVDLIKKPVISYRFDKNDLLIYKIDGINLYVYHCNNPTKIFAEQYYNVVSDDEENSIFVFKYDNKKTVFTYSSNLENINNIDINKVNLENAKKYTLLANKINVYIDWITKVDHSQISNICHEVDKSVIMSYANKYLP